MGKGIQTKHISNMTVCRHVAAYEEREAWRLANQSWDMHSNWPHEGIMSETGCCEKVAMAALDRAADYGLIEMPHSDRRKVYLNAESRALLASLK